MSLLRISLVMLFGFALLLPFSGCGAKQADNYQKTDRSQRQEVVQEDMGKMQSGPPNIENADP